MRTNIKKENEKPKAKKKKKKLRTNIQKDTKILTMVTFLSQQKNQIRKFKPQKLTRIEKKKKKNHLRSLMQDVSHTHCLIEM